MDLEVKKTIFGAILWLGVQKFVELLSHHTCKNLNKGHTLIFEVATLFVALFLLYLVYPRKPLENKPAN